MDIIKFLQQSIKFASVNNAALKNGKELDIQNWIRDQFESYDFEKVDYWTADKKGVRPNVVGVVKGKGGGKSLIFQGHCDVVPVPKKEEAQWEFDPWAGEIKDGKLYGRGASDMKGGNAALIWAAKAIIDCGIKLKGDLIVESVPGEESCEGKTIGAASTVERGYRAPFAVVAEPTNTEIHIESPGLIIFELTVGGKSAHSGSRNLVIFPQRYGIPNGMEVGVDAINRIKLFLELFERLEVQWNQRWRSEFSNSGGYPIPIDHQGIGLFVINPSLIEGGTLYAAVPGYCKLTCLAWYPSWVTQEEVTAELTRNIRAVASTDDWMREHPPEFKIIFEWEPSRVARDHAGIKVLSDSYSQTTGKEAIVSSFKAVTDATFLCQSDIPAVILGPGDLMMGVHGVNEYVPIDQVIECAKIYATMAINWCEAV